MKRKFRLAMASYAVLAILAGFTLDGAYRIGVWVLLGGIALKTYLAVIRERLD